MVLTGHYGALQHLSFRVLQGVQGSLLKLGKQRNQEACE